MRSPIRPTVRVSSTPAGQPPSSSPSTPALTLWNQRTRGSPRSAGGRVAPTRTSGASCAPPRPAQPPFGVVAEHRAAGERGQLLGDGWRGAGPHGEGGPVEQAGGKGMEDMGGSSARDRVRAGIVASGGGGGAAGPRRGQRVACTVTGR
ncbi:hypothetical protein ACFQVA_14345 [Actinomadura keratinilytica]